VSLFQPDKIFRIKLPTKKKKRATGTPSPQIVQLFHLASPQLKICIALAAFGSLRRGEICALRFGDIDGNMLHVHADMVHGADGKWHYKETPKSMDSDRYVPLPSLVLDLIGTGDPDDFIVDWCPDTITKRFIDLRKQLGLSLRFHDLRSFYASIGAALIPDIYLASFGGWSKSSKVMKEVYQKEITDLSNEYAAKMTTYFDDLFLQHDSKHDP
jgi:integrase